MNEFKAEILKHQLLSIEFVKSLENLSEKEWRTQIAEGRWTVAEIIGHFNPWDEFVINNRLPYLFSGKEFPEGPDCKITNLRLATISRNENQRTIIDNFITTRNELYQALNEIPDDYWKREFSIGQAALSLSDYFFGLTQHDCHHLSINLHFRHFAWISIPIIKCL